MRITKNELIQNEPMNLEEVIKINKWCSGIGFFIYDNSSRIYFDNNINKSIFPEELNIIPIYYNTKDYNDITDSISCVRITDRNNKDYTIYAEHILPISNAKMYELWKKLIKKDIDSNNILTVDDFPRYIDKKIEEMKDNKKEIDIINSLLKRFNFLYNSNSGNPSDKKIIYRKYVEDMFTTPYDAWLESYLKKMDENFSNVIILCPIGHHVSYNKEDQKGVAVCLDYMPYRIANVDKDSKDRVTVSDYYSKSTIISTKDCLVVEKGKDIESFNTIEDIYLINPSNSCLLLNLMNKLYYYFNYEIKNEIGHTVG